MDSKALFDTFFILMNQRLYRLRTDNKPSFFRLFETFCKETNWGSPEELTDALYGQFCVEDFGYADDSIWFGTEGYLKQVVIPHKIEVFNAGIELFKKLPQRCGIDEFEFVDNLWMHDLSKFSGIEAIGYSGWNFKTKSGNKTCFDWAWNHHKNHNPHHPEFWLSVGRGGEIEVLRMPDIYVAEMVADWIGAGKTYGNTLEQWLPENLHKFKMHQDSLIFLSEVLDGIGIATKFKRGVLFTS